MKDTKMRLLMIAGTVFSSLCLAHCAIAQNFAGTGKEELSVTETNKTATGITNDHKNETLAPVTNTTNAENADFGVNNGTGANGSASSKDSKNTPPMKRSH